MVGRRSITPRGSHRAGIDGAAAAGRRDDDPSRHGIGAGAAMNEIALQPRMETADERYLRVLGGGRGLRRRSEGPPPGDAPPTSWRTNDGRAHAWDGDVSLYWSWRSLARCQDLDSALFFSPDGERGPTRRRRERAAKAVCARCPVQAQCAAYAIANHEPYGVWGGLTETEREALWRRAPSVAPPSPAS
jgi:WhiB family redox-sensing transcriptional regulator